MSGLFEARYFSQDGVILMVIAAFALGLILGALIMDMWGDKPARQQPRPARVRPVAPPRPAARHRAPMKGGQVVLGPNQPRPQVQAEIPSAPPRGRIDVRA